MVLSVCHGELSKTLFFFNPKGLHIHGTLLHVTQGQAAASICNDIWARKDRLVADQLVIDITWSQSEKSASMYA